MVGRCAQTEFLLLHEQKKVESLLTTFQVKNFIPEDYPIWLIKSATRLL
jgi:hypothetical protein